MLNFSVTFLAATERPVMQVWAVQLSYTPVRNRAIDQQFRILVRSKIRVTIRTGTVSEITDKT